MRLTYDQEVEVLRDSFEYELCGECEQDLDQHTIAPDVLGHAHLFCTEY